MTSATVQLCTFRVDAVWLGIEVGRVQEVVRGARLTRVPRAAREVLGVFNLRGQILTAIDLRARLELAPGSDPPSVFMVVRTERRGPVALAVDQIGDSPAAGPELREPLPETLRGPSRALLLATYAFPTRLILLLDVERAADVRPALEPASAPGPAQH